MEETNMSVITLKNSIALNGRAKDSIKDRIRNYFCRNQNLIILGLYAVNGKMPNLRILRAMKMM